jgi:hypothetical protein
VNWLFGIGLAVEVGGGLLLAYPIVSRDTSKAGMLILQDEPTTEALEEVAYAEAGLLLLVLGFCIQLLGYVIESSPWGLYLVVVLAIAGGAVLGGSLFAKRILTPYIRDSALRKYQQSQAYRDEQEARAGLGQPPVD